MKIQVIDGVEIRSDNQIRVGAGIHGSGTLTRTFNHPSDFIAPSKQMCVGCEDDFYNGKNQYGVKECWAFRSATVCNKVGYSSIHVADGPDTKMQETLSCWRGVRK